jgi:hypothetical protein
MMTVSFSWQSRVVPALNVSSLIELLQLPVGLPWLMSHGRWPQEL